MNFTEITVSTTTEASDSVSRILMDAGAAGTQILDRNDLPDIDHPLHDWELMDQSVIDAFPEETEVKAWFPEAQMRAVTEELRSRFDALRASGLNTGTLAVRTALAKEEEWNETWKKYYKPFRAGKKIVIKPTWETWSGNADDLIVEIDPGMAFGTGTHETTALCVEMTEDYYHRGKMLDIGTGSGILAICAARLGAGQITAVDIDPDAVRVAEENVRQNGLEGCITVKQGDLLEGLSERFDFAVANILAPIIIRLCPALFRHLMPGAVFICSGILIEQKEEVQNALSACGYRMLDFRSRGEWCAFAVQKPE